MAFGGVFHGWCGKITSSTYAILLKPAIESFPTSLTIGRAIRPIEHPIDLARHDKIVLVQSLNLLGAQRDGRVAPAEADIGVMAFGFSQATHLSHKAERLPENYGSGRLVRCAKAAVQEIHPSPLFGGGPTPAGYRPVDP